MFVLQHVDEENSYLCGYLKIKGLTEEFPTLTTFFDGEIISAKYPFLTRKWDADEDVDRKHWVRYLASAYMTMLSILFEIPYTLFFMNIMHTSKLFNQLFVDYVNYKINCVLFVNFRVNLTYLSHI